MVAPSFGTLDLNRMKFTARFLFTESDSSIAKAGLADDQFDTQQYILFQRSLIPSEQDRLLGHDQPHVEVSDQSVSAYGAVSAVQLAGLQLKVDLDPPLFEVGSSVVVSVGTEDGLPELIEMLRLIFGPRFSRL